MAPSSTKTGHVVALTDRIQNSTNRLKVCFTKLSPSSCELSSPLVGLSTYMRSGLCLWMRAQKAMPSLKDVVMLVMDTSR